MIDIGDPRNGMLVPPGEYTLRLTVGDQVSTERIRVEPDPRVPPSADLAAMEEFTRAVRDRLTEVADLVKRLRTVRGQVEARCELLASNPDAADLVALGEQILTRLAQIERELHNPDAEVSYDILAGRHGGAKICSRLSWVFEGLRDHDGPPTQGMREMTAELTRDLAARRSALDELLAEDVARFNRLSVERELPHVIVPTPGG